MTNGGSGTGHDSVGRVGGLRRPRFISAALAVLMVAAPLAVTTLVTSSATAADTEALYAFGDNTDGALGNGTSTDAYVPTVITLPGGVTPTGGAAGGDHTLAIGSNGALYAWGLGTDGQLGNGTTTSSSTPVQVSLPPGVVPVAVAAGDDHSLALGSNGTLYAWGYNGYGQLGNGTKTTEDTPVTVTFPSGVTAIAIAAGEDLSLALGSDGNVYAWGDGNLGALGQGNQRNSSTPLKVPLPSGVTASAIAAGGRFGMAIGSDGKLYSWGDGDNAELGDGTNTFSTTPVVVEMPSGVSASVISAGGDHAMAIGSNDLLYSWGMGTDGQLGNGGTTKESIPFRVSMPTGVTAVAITGGLDSSLAIGSDGNLYAWGEGDAGELGNGGTTNSDTPVQVSLPTSPIALFPGAAADRGFVIAPPAPAVTSTTLGASASSVYYGQTLTLTASVSPTDGGGTVKFLNGASPVPGCSSLALALVGSSYQAVCSIPSLTPGSYDFSAKYGGDVRVRLVEHDDAGRRERCSGSAGRHGLVGVVDLRQHTADRHRVIQRIRERRLDVLAHEHGHLFDHGHVGQPGRSLRHVVHRCGRSQLRHQLRQRHTHGRAGAVERHRLLGNDDLRGESADHHPVVQRLCEP